MVKYLRHHPYKTVSSVTDAWGRLDGYSDANWLGCQETRVSTSGWAIALAGCVVCTASSTQPGLPALSSGESEFIAASSCSLEMLYDINLLKDFEIPLIGIPQLWVDSKSCIGTSNRLGVGRLRHLEARELHLQETIAAGKLKIGHIKGTSNGSDVLTKHVDLHTLKNHIDFYGLVDDSKIIALTARAPSSRWKIPIFVGTVLPCITGVHSQASDNVDDVDLPFMYKMIVTYTVMFVSLVVVIVRRLYRAKQIDTQAASTQTNPVPSPPLPYPSPFATSAAPASSVSRLCRVNDRDELTNRHANIVYISGTGKKWHMTHMNCPSIRDSNVVSKYEACKHCTDK